MRPSNFWIPLRDAARNQGSEQLSAFSRGQRSHHPLSAYMNRQAPLLYPDSRPQGLRPHGRAAAGRNTVRAARPRRRRRCVNSMRKIRPSHTPNFLQRKLPKLANILQMASCVPSAACRVP